MKLLILCKNQFGYHLDTWYYSKYLSDKNEVKYICFDYQKKKYTIDNVMVTYVSRLGKSAFRMLRYLYACLQEIKRGDADVIFIKYFFGCSILKFVYPSRNFVFDIRTADVSNKRYIRLLKDSIMKLESLIFDNVTIISDSLRCKLGYGKKTYILPLGAELKQYHRTLNKISLLYVGTLSGRNLDVTIKGLSKFIEKKPHADINYTIVGDGWGGELEQLQKLTTNLGLNHIVNFTGFLHHTELDNLYENSNFGVSFVPLTDYFDKQPVTKTYEYLLSGLAVIATRTTENLKIVNEKNGYLIGDNVDDFSEALHWAFKSVSSGIAQLDNMQYVNFSWQKIVTDLEAYFKSIIK